MSQMKKIVLLLVLFVFASTIFAQEAIQPKAKEKESAFKYEVAIVNKQGHVGLVNTHSAQTLGFGRLSASIWGTYSAHEDYVVGIRDANGNLGTIDPTNVEEKDFKKTALNLGIAYGVTRFMDLAFMLPVYYDWTAYTSLPNGGEFGSLSKTHMFGDLEFSMKFQYPPYPHRRFFEMAFFGGLRFNSGNKTTGTLAAENYYRAKDNDSIVRYYSGNGTELDMKMLWTWDFDEVAEHFPVKLHMNFGINWTTNPDLLHTMPFSVGVEVRPAGWIALYADFAAEPTFADLERAIRPRTSGFEPGTEIEAKQGLGHSPMRMTPGIQLMTPFGLYANAGISINLANDTGYFFIAKDRNGNLVEVETAVEPLISLAASVGWNGFILARDADSDGIRDGDDNCPKEAEDFDGFNDGDGCPEYDNDNDGVKDDEDKCPNDPEDMDGFEDEDGCPENDNDNDGVLDSKDKCPDQKEDMDGFEDEDGCPELDNDLDGVADTVDQCPNSPEDLDGYKDEDGCPELDNDMDGIVDSLDKCPSQAEVYNTFEDEDGCPDEKPAPVVIVTEPSAPAPAPVQAVEISRGDVVLRGVNFQSGKAVLKHESFIILDDVVSSLRDWPEVKLEIRGHTDSVGSESANKRLSYNRAKSVMNYIASQGIETSRLRAVGLGESSPMADNATAEGRALNRRVEMRRVD